MREQDKIDEAAFFLNEMQQHADDEAVAPDAKHRPTDPDGAAWYESHLKAIPLLGYFRNKRDANVHRQEPVEPTATRSVRHEMPWFDENDELRRVVADGQAKGFLTPP